MAAHEVEQVRGGAEAADPSQPVECLAQLGARIAGERMPRAVAGPGECTKSCSSARRSDLWLARMSCRIAG